MNAVLFAKVVNDLQLALVHPPGYGDQHEPERIQGSRHLVSSLSPTLIPRGKNQRECKQIQFPDPYDRRVSALAFEYRTVILGGSARILAHLLANSVVR